MLIEKIATLDVEPSTYKEILSYSSSKPNNLVDIDFSKLSAFHRSLLKIDGTVTGFIAAYRHEPVEVVCLDQSNLVLDQYHELLSLAKDESLIARQVLLKGVDSGIIYCYAVSLLAPQRIPDNVVDDVSVNNLGIGGAIAKGLIESRRNIIHYGYENFDVTSVDENMNALNIGKDFASRIYTVVYDGKPIMLINERFPLNLN